MLQLGYCGSLLGLLGVRLVIFAQKLLFCQAAHVAFSCLTPCKCLPYLLFPLPALRLPPLLIFMAHGGHLFFQIVHLRAGFLELPARFKELSLQVLLPFGSGGRWGWWGKRVWVLGGQGPGVRGLHGDVGAVGLDLG